MTNELFYTFILSIIAMMFGYGIHIGNRTLKLEKKNGHEQHQIDELKKKVQELEKENEKLRQEIELFKSLLAKYTSKHKSIKYHE